MKCKVLSSLTLVLVIWSAGFAQEHQGHSSPSPPVTKTGQGNQSAPARISALVKRGEEGLKEIKTAVRRRDGEALNRAVEAYVVVMDQLRRAMRLAYPDSRDFDKDLAGLEKMSRSNLDALQGLNETAASDLWAALEDATAATGEVLNAATRLRDEVNADGDYQGGQGCCGRGSADTRDQKNRGHHSGWLSRRRRC